MSKSQLVTSNMRETKLITSNKLTSLEIRQRALTIADGLTSTTPPNDMTAWYCKAYRSLGESKYIACVSIAKQPGVRSPNKMFGYLLKEELRNITG